MEPTASAAAAAAAGDPKKALKKLEKLRWGYYGDDAADVLEQVADEAASIASTATGRLAKKATKIADGARAAAAFRRNERARDAATQKALAVAKTAPDTESTYEVTPVSLAIALVGAGLLLISVFLPRVESDSLGGVVQNTLIQSGDGWFLILLAVGVAGTAWRAYYSDHRSLGPAILGLIAVGVAIYEGTSRSALRLCPVNPAAAQLGIGCSIARPSVGIYMAGVGGALAIVGGWQIWRSREAAPSDKPLADTHMEGKPAMTEPMPAKSLEARLRTLEGLRTSGLVGETEYQERRASLLDEL
jgi:hypothetical protein